MHPPAGHTSYGLIYRTNGERKKLTLGSTKILTLNEARSLAGKHSRQYRGGRSEPGRVRILGGLRHGARDVGRLK